MGLRMLVGTSRPRQLAGLVVYVVVALARSVDAVCPVEARVEPLRRVRGAALRREHVAHLVEIGPCILFRREIAALPAPVRPRSRQTVEDLRCPGLAAVALLFREIGERDLVRHGTPKEFRDTLLLHFLQARRHSGLPEIFLRDDVRRHLAPALGHLDVVEPEHDGAVRIPDFG